MIRFAIQGYQMNTVGYLMKPIEYNVFKEKFKTYLAQLDYEEKYLCIKTECNYVMIKYNELMYIDTWENDRSPYNKSGLQSATHDERIRNYVTNRSKVCKKSCGIYSKYTVYSIYEFVRNIIKKRRNSVA